MQDRADASTQRPDQLSQERAEFGGGGQHENGGDKARRELGAAVRAPGDGGDGQHLGALQPLRPKQEPWVLAT